MNYYLCIFQNIALCTCLILLEIIQLSLDDWIEQGSGATNWTGSLLSTSGAFYTNISCPANSARFCEGLMKLWRAGVLLLSFDLVSIALLLLYVYYLLKLVNRLRVNPKLMIGLCIGGCVAHLTGYIAWACLVHLRFNGNCKAIYKDFLNANVCGKTGAFFGLIISILLPFQVFSSFFTFHNLKNLVKEQQTLASPAPMSEDLEINKV